MMVIAVAHYSRLVEQSLLDIPKGVIDAAVSMGATVKDIIFRFLYVEARSALVLSMTTSTISFISYSTIMGVVGGRSEEHTSELQSRGHLVCRLLLEKKNSLL